MSPLKEAQKYSIFHQKNQYSINNNKNISQIIINTDQSNVSPNIKNNRTKLKLIVSEDQIIDFEKELD